MERKRAAAVLVGERLNGTAIRRAAEMAVVGATPLAKNGYKVDLVKGLVTQALTELRDAS